MELEDEMEFSSLFGSCSKKNMNSTNPSLIDLWGSAISCDTISDVKTLEESHTAYDRNVAFSREPRTEYDNIVNALTSFILQFFIQRIDIDKCLASDKVVNQEERESENNNQHEMFGIPQPISAVTSGIFQDSSDHVRVSSKTKLPQQSYDANKFKSWNTLNEESTKQLRNMSSNVTVASTLTNEGERTESVNSVLTSEESVEDIDNENYFSKFKGRDINVKVEFKNGNKYEGRISCFMMNGEGTYTWKDGTLFSGTFINGIAQGKGYFLWPGRGWYYGEVKDNQRHGKGICLVRLDDAEVCYYGRWKNGQRHGKGVIVFGDSDWYDGNWKNNQMHGYGFRMYRTGSYYRGYWKHGSPHGKGTMFWSQNDTYTGMWRKGKMHGRGIYVWRTLETSCFVFPLRNIYEGSWKKGKKHGNGSLLLASGAMMSTFWHYDKKTGPGQIICKNGLVLESPLLFSGDKIFDIGKPVEIPLWNKWYYDFLKPYQDGITKIEAELIFEDKENSPLALDITRYNIPHMKRKQCLNNIPLLEPVDTMPLWNFIEMVSREQAGSERSLEQNMAQMVFEEQRLRKVISKNVPFLSFLYQHYAKIGCTEEPEYDCFMLRIMVWQLCLDCNIERSCLTLCSLNKKIGCGSYPFDIIPFFEMIQYLLYLAYELCMKTGLTNRNIPGLCASGFDYFISKIATAAVCKQNDLPTLYNWLPLHELFLCYNSFGSPVTFRKILKKLSITDGLEEEFSLSHGIPMNLPLKELGKNVITFDGNITFEYVENTGDEVTYIADFNDLAVIGETTINEILNTCCPRATENRMKREKYEVSFLEFCYFVMKALTEYRNLMSGHDLEEQSNTRNNSPKSLSDETKLP